VLLDKNKPKSDPMTNLGFNSPDWRGCFWTLTNAKRFALPAMFQFA